MSSVRILTAHWQRLRRAYPHLDEAELAAEVVRRGSGLIQADPGAMPGPGDDAWTRAERLRAWVPRLAATAASYVFQLVTGRERFAVAEHAEVRTYEEHLDLDTRVVPPLKNEAKALRAELRELERLLRERGVDPEAIEPRVDWGTTLAVDSYERPQYETNESRRKAALEFFRRL